MQQDSLPTLSSDVATERRTFLGLAGLAGAGLAALIGQHLAAGFIPAAESAELPVRQHATPSQLAGDENLCSVAGIGSVAKVLTK